MTMQIHYLKNQVLLTLLKLLDIFLMLTALVLSLFVQEMSVRPDISVWDILQIKLKVTNVILLPIFIVVWHLIFLAMQLYDSRRLDRGKGEWKDIGKAVLIGSMCLLAATVVFQRHHFDKQTVLFFALASGLLTWSGRKLMRTVLRELRRSSRNLHNLLLVGGSDRALDLVSRIMAKPSLGYRLVGYIDDPDDGQAQHQLALILKSLGPLQDFDLIVEHNQIDEVVIALPIHTCYEPIKRIVEACELQGIQVHLLLSDFFPLKISQARPTLFETIPILTLATGPSTLVYATLKRTFDVAVTVPLVVLLSPVFGLVALLLKIFSPEGPVFFVQSRIGYNRHPFNMIKFRTMVPDAEHLQAQLEALNEVQGPVFKIMQDPRITPIGRFLRKTSLDELPQLFNVIKGDMSLVGPRPLPRRDVERFEESWLNRRFSVRPGITCLWQISGRSNTNFDKWIEQDLEYIDHWSFGLDLKILAKTIPVVLKGTGAQ